MCKSAKKVLRKVAGVIRKIWNVVRKYIAYIAFVVVLFFPYVWPLLMTYVPAGLAATISGLTAGTVFTAGSLKALAWRAVIGLATAFLISSDAGKGIVDKAADVVGKVVKGAGEVAGTVAGAVLSNPWVIAAAGAVALLFLSNRKNTTEVVYVGDGYTE